MSRLANGWKSLPFRRHIHTESEAHQSSYPMGFLLITFPEEKRSEREADQSPVYSAVIKKSRSCVHSTGHLKARFWVRTRKLEFLIFQYIVTSQSSLQAIQPTRYDLYKQKSYLFKQTNIFRPISHLHGPHVIQMLKEEVALFTGSGTCRYMYKHGHIQTEDLMEKSLHFITAQSELTTLADEYSKTLWLAHFKIILILFYLRRWCQCSTLCNYIKEFHFSPSPQIVFLLLAKPAMVLRVFFIDWHGVCEDSSQVKTSWTV